MPQLLLPKRSSCCTFCKKKFRPGDDLITILSEDESFVREDLCITCAREEKNCIGSWKSIYPKERSVVGIEELMQRLINALDEERAYPLALYLQRRGALQRVKTLKRKSGDVALFETVESGECFQIPIVHGTFEKERVLGQ